MWLQYTDYVVLAVSIVEVKIKIFTEIERGQKSDLGISKLSLH